MSVEQKRKRVDVALGKEKADLVIKNGKIINVFTKEIIEGDIAVFDGIIVGIGKYDGYETIDAEGKVVCPGLIDSHVHIESTMVSPGEFARAILPHGTTTIIADPHEIANVCGLEGVQYMLNQTKDLPINVFLMIPSCVPATAFENNGASLTAEAMEPFSDHPRILGLGEVMDYNAVLAKEEGMLDKIELFDHAVIDGHGAGIAGKDLCAYRSVGIMTNHECSSIEEVLENLRLGMVVQIREGSAAKNLETIVKGLLERGISFDRCLFCTDDKHLEDIRREGHISHNIRKAIKCGVDPIEAIRMATWNAAQCYRLKRLGALAPGYSADMLILSDLESFTVEKVFYRGTLVSEDGSKPEVKTASQDRNVSNTVRIPQVGAEHLKISLDVSEATVITLLPHQLVTKIERVMVERDPEGFFMPAGDLSKIAVIERHKAIGSIGLGIVKGFGIRGGAIASTIAHDSHNLMVIGDNDEDMLEAIHELKRVNGGLTVVSRGKVMATLPLPIAGLMSDRDSDWVEEQVSKMLKMASDLGVAHHVDPFITLSFLALPVIPEIRVTDKGLFDVNRFEFIRI